MTTVTVTSGPRNARIDSTTGLRFYTWQGQELVSVTSARNAAGAPPALVRWQLGKVCDRAVDDLDTLTAMLSREKRPRERALEKNRRDEARRYLRQAAEDERDHKAARGSAVHAAAEHQMPVADVTDYVRYTVVVPLLGADGEQLRTEKGTVRRKTVEREGFGLEEPADALEVTSVLTIPADEIRGRLRQFYAWVSDGGAEVLSREGQVFNLTVGYAGSYDMIVRLPDGRIVIVDIKTGDRTYYDHVIQQAAYEHAEFVGRDDVVDEATTALLRQVSGCAILHLEDDGWSLKELQTGDEAWIAFRGLLAFARASMSHDDEATYVTGTTSGADRAFTAARDERRRLRGLHLAQHTRADTEPSPDCTTCQLLDEPGTAPAGHVHEFTRPPSGKQMEQDDWRKACACGTREPATA